MSHGAYAESVNELVCLDMPCGDAFVSRLQKAWDDGDAIFPLDQRLPAPARAQVLHSIAPTRIVTEDSETKWDGRRVETGDAVVVATSGTTGSPKGVVLTHSAIAASAFATSKRLNVKTDDKWFACLPMSHVGGLSVVLRSIITGTRLHTASQFSVESYNKAADNGATLVSLVATALQRVNPSRYRTIVLGGSRPPTDRPANTVTTYGMTETGSGVVYDGKPLDDVEIRIVDGIIHLRAPMLLRAYRDETIPFTSDGWFRTGDIGSYDGTTLTVNGREGDLIITGGENVWPEQVEDCLRNYDNILDVCVAGVPHPEWGQQVTAWIVVDSETTVTLEEIREFVKETLPAHCAPRALRVVEEIPRTSLGKPKRTDLVACFSAD